MSILSKFLNAGAVILSIFFLLDTPHAAVLQKDYDALILTTKGNLSAEQLTPAITQLTAWHTADPQNLHLVYDLAALLDKAADYSAASELTKTISQPNAPAYALMAIAHANLKAGHFLAAESAYQLALEKTPDDIQAHVGLVYAWMGQQRMQQALDYIQHFLPLDENYSGREVPMLVAQAELYEQRKDWLQAASSYQHVLKFDPGFRYAKRGFVFALSQAGLTTLANYYAGLDRSIFTEVELYQLAYADAATTIRFGEAQLAADSHSSRVNTMDIALAENAAVLRLYGAPVRAKFDRIIALNGRGYMQEAVQLYQSLLDEKVVIPAYVKFAVADAYLYLQQPETARDLYLEQLAELGAADPGSSQRLQIPLINAYSDAGQYTEAEALAAQIVANQVSLVDRSKTGAKNMSQDYLRAVEVAANQQKNDDHLALAEQQLTWLHTQAPFNNDIRSAWAGLLQARDHPHAAFDEFSMMLLDDPTSLDAALGRAELLLSMDEFSQSKNVLPALIANYPENKSVQNYARRLENYGLPSYRLETTFGRGAATSGADSLSSALMYSSPFSLQPDTDTDIGSDADNWSNQHLRAFAHVAYAKGVTVSGVAAARSRAGIGIDYRASDVAVEVEATHTLNDTKNNGVALALSRTLSDNWHARAAIDTNVIDLPAAAMNLGVTAKQQQLEIDWSQNESRKAGGEISSVQFSDNNLRKAARLWWIERWISEPVFKLDSEFSVSSSSNSAINRAYFNPAHDKEADIDLKAQWLTWHRYSRSFTQRVDLSVGQYTESGYAAAATAGIRYEHEWDFENELGFTYGAGRNFHPYDGAREYRDYLYLNLSGRIK